jgi:ankyrin repeat protein
LSSHYTGTPLHCALTEGHEEMVRFLIDKGADIKQRCPQGREDANTCLHLAAASGKPGLVRLVLDSGLEVDVRDHWLATPLHDAVICGHKEVVELLIARGADVNAVRAVLHPDKGIMPLDIAVERLHGDIAELLRSRGAKRWEDLSEEEREEKSKMFENFKP